MAHQQEYQAVTPFVKWAGGKRQLLSELREHIPAKFGTYYEPFVGGGAMTFSILSDNPQATCSLSDLNSDLIITYVTVRDRVEELISSLRKHAANYVLDSKVYYYATRAAVPRSQVGKASRLLFLNKTCFNGLYRVNSNGQFNVPIGSYTNPNIVNADALRAASRALRSRKISINCCDFTAVLRTAKRGDFVYFDPPYRPTSKTSSFTSYTRMDFGMRDFARLAETCDKLSKRGCYVLMSNSDVSDVRTTFNDDWSVDKLHAKRAINSVGSLRNGCRELLIQNY